MVYKIKKIIYNIIVKKIWTKGPEELKMKFIFKTSATMKDYNSGKWWIDEGIIKEKIITADSTAEALDKYVKSVESDDYTTITKNAIKNKKAMYIDNESGEAEQCGYIITASQDFQDDDGKLSKQYIDLWITILTVVPTKF